MHKKKNSEAMQVDEANCVQISGSMDSICSNRNDYASQSINVDSEMLDEASTYYNN